MQDIITKAKKIKLLLLDVDGVLTDGTIYLNDEGESCKGFNMHDGLGLKLLRQAGLDTGVISAKDSPCVQKRATDLHITHIYLGQTLKLPAYEEIKQKTGLADEQIAYIGDDLLDLVVLKRVGLALTVANAASSMADHVDHVTTKPGGHGAVREVCELILKAQGLLDPLVQSFMKG